MKAHMPTNCEIVIPTCTSRNSCGNFREPFTKQETVTYNEASNAAVYNEDTDWALTAVAQVVLQDVEHARELREEQHLVAVRAQVPQQLVQQLQLAARLHQVLAQHKRLRLHSCVIEICKYYPCSRMFFSLSFFH